MIDYETIVSKVRRLPEPLLREVEDFIDFLQMKRRGTDTVAGSQTTHPVMLAFGLWKDEKDLDDLVDRVYANRQRQLSRPQVSL
jgi:hypothetical protein